MIAVLLWLLVGLRSLPVVLVIHVSSSNLITVLLLLLCMLSSIVIVVVSMLCAFISVLLLLILSMSLLYNVVDVGCFVGNGDVYIVVVYTVCAAVVVGVFDFFFFVIDIIAVPGVGVDVGVTGVAGVDKFDGYNDNNTTNIVAVTADCVVVVGDSCVYVVYDVVAMCV